MSNLSVHQFAQYSPRTLEIVDSTLREGQQTPLLHRNHKFYFDLTDKEEILRSLISYGVRFIELFAPTVSPKEQEDFSVLKTIRDSLILNKGYTFLLAHVRCRPDDVEAAINAGFDGLNFFIGTSSISRRANHGYNINEIIQNMRALIEDVRRNYPGLILRFSGEDMFRTNEDELYRVYDSIMPFVDRFGCPDTVGVATPSQVQQKICSIRDRYPKTDLEVHFHNDRGLSLINALEATRNCVRYVDTTILGIGERSGITSLTALLFNLFADQDYEKLNGYQLDDSFSLNILIAEKLGISPILLQDPISSINRKHIAGIHQKAMLKDRASYEAHHFERFGVKTTSYLIGPFSGWHAIQYYLKDKHNISINEFQAKKVSVAFKKLTYRETHEMWDRIIIEIVREQLDI
jgi:homocitrate synthase